MHCIRRLYGGCLDYTVIRQEGLINMLACSYVHTSNVITKKYAFTLLFCGLLPQAMLAELQKVDLTVSAYDLICTLGSNIFSVGFWRWCRSLLKRQLGRLQNFERVRYIRMQFVLLKNNVHLLVITCSSITYFSIYFIEYFNWDWMLWKFN